jgi:signal transduction histidine kinase/ActR/RegA family two-component response regulator
MFSAILQSLSSLLLLGVFSYAIFVSEALKNRKRTGQALIGLVCGCLVISLGLSSYVSEPHGVLLNAQAGPLVFAGYLGGPIGGLITGTLGAVYKLSEGRPLSGFGIFLSLVLPLIGVLVHALRPSEGWPAISRTALGMIVVGYMAHFIVPVAVVTTHSAAADSHVITLRTTLEFATVGTISIVLTWLILNYAAAFATEAARSRKLAKHLDLTLQHTKIGLFEFNVGEPNINLDADSIAILGLDQKPGLVPMQVWADKVHPDDLAGLQADIRAAFSGEAETDWVDYRMIHPDGTLRYIRGFWTAERDQTGRAVRITGLNSDQTRIHADKQQHQESIERLAVIAENLPGVVFEIDVTDRQAPELTYISPKCQFIWGRTDEELYANPGLFFEAHDPEDIADFTTALEAGISSGKPVSHRYQITRQDGEKRWLDYHGGSTSVAGRIKLEALVLDVTREVEGLKQIEHEREIAFRAQKSESIGQLTGGISHDFNNLLAVILGNLELLEDETDPTTQKPRIRAATTATLRGADLTRNLLAFARKARLTPEVLDLNTVVREAKSWIGRTLPKTISVETSLRAGLWPVAADRSSLESALLNLILNAQHAMAEHGEVTIETTNLHIEEAIPGTGTDELAPGRYVVLAVSDTGEGIREEDLASIFEPFFTTKPPGSGLGLSMTIGFMRQSGGTMQVATERGVGTTFKLFFPVTAQQEQPSRPEKSQADLSGADRSVLIAEDEAAVRATLVTMLSRADYSVTAAKSGDEALKIFQADPTFDLLLTDIVMPGRLQGTHLARAVKQLRADVPVIFMSGYASESKLQGTELDPDDTRLVKPVRRADLLAALANALRA